MNQLTGKITDIETDGGISLVTISVAGMDFSSLIIDSPATVPYLANGNEVYMLFKETEMSIAKHFTGGLSTRNRFPATIRAIKPGQILSKIVLDFKGHILYSIITTKSMHSLHLQVGDHVEGLVKTNEVSLMQVSQ